MSEFAYIAHTLDGIRKEGVIDALNINEASDKLRDDDLVVVKLSERDTSFDFIKPFLDRLSIAVEELKN